jgi:hypothetical protein
LDGSYGVDIVGGGPFPAPMLVGPVNRKIYRCLFEPPILKHALAELSDVSTLLFLLLSLLLLFLLQSAISPSGSRIIFLSGGLPNRHMVSERTTQDITRSTQAES